MAPRGRKKKAGMMREDGARDAMRAFGFAERLISVCIKELLEVYGAEGWFLIEECSYLVLLNKCLEKSAEQGPNLLEDRVEERAEEQNDEMVVEAEQEQNHEMVEAVQEQNIEMMVEEEKEQHDEMVAEAEPEQNHQMVEAVQEQNIAMLEAEQEHTPQQEEEKEQEQQVENGRDHVGSNSTSLVGCVAETGTKTCQTEALPTTSETEILDSSPVGEASVIDYASPAAFPSADASGGFAQHSAVGARSSGCGGWISDSDEDSDPVADSVGDDDEIIQLTPEPLSEELEELVKTIRGEKKRRTRWED